MNVQSHENPELQNRNYKLESEFVVGKPKGIEEYEMYKNFEDVID